MRQKTSVFDKDNSILLWNAYAQKLLLKNRLTVRLMVNDILGANAGINRTISANQITQTSSNIIGRYWMISGSWRLIAHHKLKQ